EEKIVVGSKESAVEAVSRLMLRGWKTERQLARSSSGAKMREEVEAGSNLFMPTGRAEQYCHEGIFQPR
ncbi:hypothetical protein, partial [Blastopirellula retiformator]|uniref:hypothetical protein n=1 Tax=Blastopirellula retiformator TaxID=2527970 RepID=UPI001C98D46B